MPGPDSTEPKANPDELARWWREHSDLDQLVHELVETMEARSLPAASAALEELLSALEGHFSVEEEVYFPLVERLRPEFSSVLERARFAHAQLNAELKAMAGHLTKGEADKAKDVLAAALALFRVHEEMEGSLIADLSTASAG